MPPNRAQVRRSRMLLIITPLVLALAGTGVFWALRHTAIAPPPPSPVSPPAAPPVLEFAMFRGNSARNLSAIGTVPRRPKLLWRLRTHTKFEGKYEQRGSTKLSDTTPWSGLGWTGQPVRRGDLLYFGSSDSYVYCVRADSGQVVWYYPNHHCVKGSITLAGDYLYHGGRDNKLHCYDLRGRMVWETRTGNDMDSNPVVDGSRLFIGGEDKSIYSFHAQGQTPKPTDGTVRWRLGGTNGSVESSPCLAEGRVYAGSGHGTLYCCDAETGKRLWTFDTKGDTDSTPVYYDGRLYVGCATGDTGEKGHLWCVDAATGKAIWHVPFKRGFWATAALNPQLGRLYIGNNNGVFYAMNMTDGAIVWKRALANRIWGSAAVTDGAIVVGTRDGQVWCLDEQTGEPLWAFDDGFDIDATPLVAGGEIVIGSQNGWVYGIGGAPEGEAINSHWFITDFPVHGRTDHDAEGIVTADNPAPPPATYRDTSAKTRTHYLQPVYGPGYQALLKVRAGAR